MPIGPTAYLVLAALQDGPLHGYAVLQRIQELVPDERSVPVATLYATIERLAHDELLEMVREEIVDGRARRTYRLTADGRAALLAESARLAHAASLVKRPVTVRRVKPAVAR